MSPAAEPQMGASRANVTVATPHEPTSAGDPQAGAAAAVLAELRGRIQQIDRELVGLIAERVRLARDVGDAKRTLGVPILDPAREAAVVRSAGELGREAGIGDEDVRYIFWHVIGLSRRAQMEGE